MTNGQVRPAIISDKPRAIEMLRAFNAAWRPMIGIKIEGAPESLFEFRAEYAERLFLAHLRGGYTLALVCDVEGMAQGLLLARAFEHELAPVFIAQETAWWIEPDHRGRAAMTMLDAYEAWARSRNCVLAGMAGLGEAPEVANLYRRRGYAGTETHFLKAL